MATHDGFQNAANRIAVAQEWLRRYATLLRRPSQAAEFQQRRGPRRSQRATIGYLVGWIRRRLEDMQQGEWSPECRRQLDAMEQRPPGRLLEVRRQEKNGLSPTDTAVVHRSRMTFISAPLLLEPALKMPSQ